MNPTAQLIATLLVIGAISAVALTDHRRRKRALLRTFATAERDGARRQFWGGVARNWQWQ